MQRATFPQVPDEELVIYALLGDLPAYDELVRRFRVAVVLVAEQVLRERSAAEDVAQEAFLLAFKALPQLQHPSKFAGWLCAIARHRARRVAARDNRFMATEPSQLDLLLLAHSRELAAPPEEAWERRYQYDCLAREVAALPDEFRIALQLYYYEEWPIARVAAFLSLPVSTVKWRLHRGRHLLRQRFITSEES
jgi:RNA polymerase sigma-70 factor (ECF subfamily)